MANSKNPESEKKIQFKNEPTRDVNFAELQKDLQTYAEQEKNLPQAMAVPSDISSLQAEFESEVADQNIRNIKDEKTQDVDFKTLQKVLASIPSPALSVTQKNAEEDERKTEDIDISELQKERNPIQKKPAPLKISPYFLDENMLGEGADAQVYLAYSDESKQFLVGVVKVAKKGHEPQMFKEIELAKRFIHGQLQHPHIVSFIRTGVTALGLPFLVNEYMNPFPRKTVFFVDAFAITTKIAQAIAYLHKNRIFHRDIKPQNIKYVIYGTAIVPKLFDFGTVTNQINDAQNAACSPYFAAPEVFLRIRGHSMEEIQFSRSDVFGLGMTLLGLMSFNPYLAIEPDLEKKYPNVRVLIDRLIETHQKAPASFFQVIDSYIRTNYRWTETLQNGFGFQEKPYELFLREGIDLLKQSLSIKPEDRPKSAQWVQQMENIFLKAFGIPVDHFLNNGGSLYTSGPNIPAEEFLYAPGTFENYDPYYYYDTLPTDPYAASWVPYWSESADPALYPAPYPTPEMNNPPSDLPPAFAPPTFAPPPMYSTPEPETQMFSKGVAPSAYYVNPASTPPSSAYYDQTLSGRMAPPSQSNTTAFVPPSNWPTNSDIPPSTTSAFEKADKLRKTSFYSSEMIKTPTEGNFSVLPTNPNEKITNKLVRKISSPISNPPSSRIIAPPPYNNSEEEKMRPKTASTNVPFPPPISLPKKNELPGSSFSLGSDSYKASPDKDKGKSLTKNLFSQPVEEQRITPRMPSSIIKPPSNPPFNPNKHPQKPEK